MAEPIDPTELQFAVWRAFESLRGEPVDLARPDAPPLPPLTPESIARKIKAALDELDPVQLAITRRLSGAQRLAQMFSLCEFARQQAQAAIRRQHPNWDESEVQRLLRARIQGNYYG